MTEIDGPVLAVIPCRRGSKRLPGKNTRLLGGRPMVDYTLEPALVDEAIDEVLVTSDDPAVIARAAALGCSVDYERPAELSEDGTTSYDTVIHALDWYRDRVGRDPAILILLQVTSPLRPADIPAQALGMLAAAPSVDGVVGMRRIGVSSDNVFVAPGENETRLQRLQGDRPDRLALLVPNGAVYALRVPAFRREKTFMPAHTLPLIMKPSASLDIDTFDDFTLAEAALAHRPNESASPASPIKTDR